VCVRRRDISRCEGVLCDRTTEAYMMDDVLLSSRIKAHCHRSDEWQSLDGMLWYRWAQALWRLGARGIWLLWAKFRNADHLDSGWSSALRVSQSGHRSYNKATMYLCTTAMVYEII
jgi:hypothetical protein